MKLKLHTKINEQFEESDLKSPIEKLSVFKLQLDLFFKQQIQ